MVCKKMSIEAQGRAAAGDLAERIVLHRHVLHIYKRGFDDVEFLRFATAFGRSVLRETPE